MYPLCLGPWFDQPRVTPPGVAQKLKHKNEIKRWKTTALGFLSTHHLVLPSTWDLYLHRRISMLLGIEPSASPMQGTAASSRINIFLPLVS